MLLASRTARRLLQVFIFAAFILLSPAHAPAQTAKRFSYHFENARFDISLIDIEIGEDGKGAFRFRTKDVDQTVESPLSLKPETVLTLQRWYSELGYLRGGELYQHRNDFSHLGTITIGLSDGEGRRKTSFNYTQHPVMSKLADSFRNIATQELAFFRIELAIRHYPLDTPRELTALEQHLKGNRIPEPDRFLPLLRQIVGSEQMLLIAKRQAGKLLKEIEKTNHRS